jgi:predicted metal-binding protein
MNNQPIYRCHGCEGTGGRLACPVHGQSYIKIKSDEDTDNICKKHNTPLHCDECKEINLESISDLELEKLRLELEALLLKVEVECEKRGMK